MNEPEVHHPPDPTPELPQQLAPPHPDSDSGDVIHCTHGADEWDDTAVIDPDWAWGDYKAASAHESPQAPTEQIDNPIADKRDA